jgi:hypothetical protein
MAESVKRQDDDAPGRLAAVWTNAFLAMMEGRLELHRIGRVETAPGVNRLRLDTRRQVAIWI